MWWNRAILSAAVLAYAAFAGEQQSTPGFEAVPPPQLNLQRPDLDREPAEPEAPPAAPPAAAPPAAAQPSPWWNELQQGLDKELSPAAQGSANSPGAPTTEGEAASSGPGAGMSMLRGVIAMCVVLALILVCYYLVNRYGRKGPLFAGSGLGHVLGRIHLSPRAELHFVRIKDRVLVVGVTQDEVSRVAEFDAAMFETEKSAAPAPGEAHPVAQSVFARELRTQTLPEPTANALSDEIAALKADLDKARKYFRESTGESGAV